MGKYRVNWNGTKYLKSKNFETRNSAIKFFLTKKRAKLFDTQGKMLMVTNGYNPRQKTN